MGEAKLQVWGGAEYTCNRVDDRYFDQMILSGHADRPDDCAAFRALGLTSLRVGLLWERHVLDPGWHWADERLGMMQACGIEPLVGLVHHGSGPLHTGLLEDNFAPRLAAYAGEVAARYPWIDAYTPINEPNTTARFSGLYGFWFPHHKSRRSYLQALLNQSKATVLSMEAIRRVNSSARLIQTDDAGRIYSTPELGATRDLMDERRWLQADLLCGRVEPGHPLWDYIADAGIPAEEVLWFRDHPCPPDVLGINYYVTSDRFLDHRTHLRPHLPISDEGAFHDLEAVRARPEGITGHAALLLEAHARYGLPTAITEVHLGDSVEQQIRWAVEAWHGAQRAREAGADCRAITFWALLGSYFWSSLVRCDNGHYEPGVFDARSGKLQATELADVIAQLARDEEPVHPALAHAGWWHQPSRLHDVVEREEEFA